MIRSLINDTLTDLVSLRNWLDNLGGIRADHQIINTYLAEDYVTDALTLANMLPGLYKLEGNELAEHNYYMNMLNLQIDLSQQNRSVFDLDSMEINNIVVIAETSHGLAGAQAKGILELAYGYEFCNCLNVTDSLGYKSTGIINMESLDQFYGISISVKPNPAKEWTSFNYNLPDNSIKGIIKIVDVTGKIVETVEVSGTEGQYIWDTRKIESGVYIYTFSVNGIINTDKIVIQK